MKEGWKEIRIGDLGKVITGNTPPKKDPANFGGQYPFIKPTDMEIDRRHVTVWEETYSEKAFKKYKNSFIPPKSTGVVTIGTVGEKIFQADRYCFTNQSVNVVIPNDSFDEDFVYYLLKINLPKVENANPGTASGRHHVSKSNFCAIKISVPKSKETQRKIASILSAYDDLIENNLRRIKLLEEMAQLTYEEWFVRMKFPGHETTAVDEETGLPEGWERVKAIEKIKLISGYAFKSKEFTDVPNNNIAVRMGNFKVGGGLKFNKSKYLIDASTVRTKFKLAPNDMLMVLSDVTREGLLIGNVGLIPNDNKNYFLNQRVSKLVVDDFLKMYLYAVFNSQSFKHNCVSKANSVTVLNLKNDDVYSFNMVIPTNGIIEKWNIVYGDNVKIRQNLQKQNKLLKEARDILLPRLMTGMIDVEGLKGLTITDTEK